MGCVNATFIGIIRSERQSLGDEIRNLGLAASAPLCEKLEDTPEKSIEKKENSTQTNSETKKEEIGNSNLMKRTLGVAFGCFLLVVVFTFFGAVEVGHITYVPATWISDLGLPEPIGLKFSQNYGVW